MEGNNSLLVTTEALQVGAIFVEEDLAKINQIFEQIDEYNNKILPRWEGEGVEAYKKTYQNVREHVEEINARLLEHIRDLREMAGIYEAAEEKNVEEADALPSDAII